MLKIKDDIDLKELEKFGFVYEEDDVTWDEDPESYIIKYYSDFEANKLHPLYIDIETRIIDDGYIDKNYAEIVPSDLIFDLIQAGLVEKIENIK